MFMVDVWMPEGTDIRATNDKLQELEHWLAKQEEADTVTTTAGKGLQRFMLTYSPEKVMPPTVRSPRGRKATTV